MTVFDDPKQRHLLRKIEDAERRHKNNRRLLTIFVFTMILAVGHISLVTLALVSANWLWLNVPTLLASGACVVGFAAGVIEHGDKIRDRRRDLEDHTYYRMQLSDDELVHVRQYFKCGMPNCRGHIVRK